MGDFLIESGNRAMRPGIVQPFMRGTNAKYEEDMKILMGYVENSASTFPSLNYSTAR